MVRVYALVHDARDDAFSGVWHSETGLAAAVVDEVYALFGTSEVHVCVELALQLQVLHAFEAGDGFCFVHPHFGYRYVSIDAPYFYSVGGDPLFRRTIENRGSVALENEHARTACIQFLQLHKHRRLHHRH